MISLITPCRNAEKFIEATIRSVLDQNYPDLEYIVADGASTDGTLDVIRRYESRLAGWFSEGDSGPYDALNKGFARSHGEIMGWLNADDLHCRWTLQTVADIFASCPEVEWISSRFPLTWDVDGQCRSCYPIPGFNSAAFSEGRYIGSRPGGFGWIQQESTFWRRSLWEKVGGMIPCEHQLAGDFHLWMQFFRHAELYGMDVPLAGFRRHAEQLSRAEVQYEAECEEILRGAPLNATGTMRARLRRLGIHRIPWVRTRLSGSWKYHGKNIASTWDDRSRPRWGAYSVLF